MSFIRLHHGTDQASANDEAQNGVDQKKSKPLEWLW